MCFCASPPRWRGRHRLSTIRRQRLSSDHWVPYESLTTLRTIPSTLPRRPTPTQRGSGLACSPPAGRFCSPRAVVGRPTRPRDRTEVPGKLHTAERQPQACLASHRSLHNAACNAQPMSLTSVLKLVVLLFIFWPPRPTRQPCAPAGRNPTASLPYATCPPDRAGPAHHLRPTSFRHHSYCRHSLGSSDGEWYKYCGGRALVLQRLV